jgi:putative RNA 2'-phosphotransferase
MTDKQRVSISRFLSLVLRHKPEKAGITLDANGWADVAALIEGMNESGRTAVTIENIKEVVASNDKQRFAFSDDYTKIRANQGHSVSVDVELVETEPPAVLFHGTAAGSVRGIFENGIRPKTRLYVHLSADEETAVKVGRRHGKPVVLSIDAARMHEDGYKFFLSANGVWLTEYVSIC